MKFYLKFILYYGFYVIKDWKTKPETELKKENNELKEKN